MLKQFAQKIESFKRLIGNSQSASFRHSVNKDGASVRFLLAVSGGMDSMCMLDLFSQVVSVEDFAVAHCNFSLRGEESDGDQNLVELRAQELGVKLFVKRFDTVSYAQEKGISIEMAARDLRYEWFAQVCQEHGFDAVVVAHNANDNAETLVLNLLRGTGLNGLHGMQEVQGRWMFEIPKTPVCASHIHPLAGGGMSSPSQIIPADSHLKLYVFRPMLEVTRKQIEGYVLANKVPYRDDSSNLESDYKRNRIRNEVFPIFEKVNPSFVKTLNREIRYFAEAGSIVEAWCQSQIPNVLVAHEPTVSISLPSLLATDYWRYLLYYILQPYGFNSAILESLENLLDSDRTISGKCFESSTHILYTERDSLVVRPKMSERQVAGTDIVVTEEGIYNLNGVRFQIKVVERTPDFNLKQPVGTVIMDADKMAFPFVCRGWKQGDWFVPFGMKGRKKVSDLFANLKFSNEDKSRTLMLVDCRGDLAEIQHVAGVLGYRIDDRYKVDNSTKKILLINILNNTDTI